ncbi:major facilitator superfamily transporter [Mycena metata]|uniref:Major facilitator superfamily transporter n=1 Tax=Mycena metata TaxID=1033252 RepID=A0AAD7IM50_9AGAR|nr:major facilitator superfamily transporter [Mycena metata]
MSTAPSNEGETLNGSSHSLSRVASNEKNETVVNTKENVAEPTPATTQENEDDYPHGLKLALLSLALCLSVFLALDNTIIATAIPKITDQFHSLDDVGWATASVQLLFGKFYTFLPIKSVYLTAILLFEVGSALCGGAPNSNALIIGRAIAGLGSAGIFTGALIIVAHAVPLTRRPIYRMYGIASVAGPLLGGTFTDKVFIFAVTVIVMVFFFKMPKSADHVPSNLTLRERIIRFDPLGTLMFIPAIISLLLALQWGGSKYPWNSGRIIALFVLFGVLIIAFVAIQIWQQENATVPPRIFKQRSIWASSWFSLCLGSSFFILVFYLPIWFQAIKGVSAVRSGIDNLPMILALVVGSMLAGILITQFGYYTPFMLLSSVLMAVGAGLLSTLKPDTPAPRWIGYQIVFGFGVGTGMQGPLLAAQTALSLLDVPIGTSTVMFVQTLGGALFISVGQNVFQNKLISGLVAKVPGVSPLLVLSSGATNLKNAVDPKYLADVISVYNTALITAFYVSIAMGGMSIFGSLLTEWKSVKGKNVEMGMAA